MYFYQLKMQTFLRLLIIYFAFVDYYPVLKLFLFFIFMLFIKSPNISLNWMVSLNKPVILGYVNCFSEIVD